MAKNSSFREDLVRQLAEILNETDLTEIEYELDNCRIRVARHLPFTNSLVMPGSITTPLSASNASTTAPTPAILEPTPAPTSQSLASHPGVIKSPLVGNAYLSPAPGAETFVKVGQPVKAGDTILIVEAMKVMNPIKTPKAGIVKQLLVQNNEPVEFDQPLAIIE